MALLSSAVLNAGMPTGSILIFGAAFLIYLLGEVGVPFPLVSQGVLFYAGYQAARGATLLLVPLLVGVVLGSACGSALVYWLGRHSGLRLVEKYGKYLRLKPESLEKARHRVQTLGFVPVVLGRLTPGLMVPTSIVSGLLRLRLLVFLAGVVVSEVVWNGTFLGLGALAARHARLAPVMEALPTALAVLAVAALVAALLFLFWKRKAGETEESDSIHEAGGAVGP